MFDHFFEHVSELVYYVLVGLVSLLLILGSIFLGIYIIVLFYKLIQMVYYFIDGRRYFRGEPITDWLWEKFNCVQRINQRESNRH